MDETDRCYLCQQPSDGLDGLCRYCWQEACENLSEAGKDAPETRGGY